MCVILVFCNGRVCDGIATMMSILDGENKKFLQIINLYTMCVWYAKLLCNYAHA